MCKGDGKILAAPRRSEEPRGNAITITTQASGTAKIDPLIAALPMQWNAYDAGNP